MFPNMPPVEARGSGGGCTLYRLKEGIERFFITDINNPAGSAQVQSSLPVMHDGLRSTVAPNGNMDQSAMVSRFNHIPGGCNVLWMDGHTEFVKYPGKYPISHYMALESPGTGATAGVNINNYLNNNPTIPRV